ncbi:MAG: hypothetical protein EKK61_03655 [Rickettsiales bacterium]|nr:MAG: hypothetical protein EKK61_03655 [Rickettsiales bacterium]
MSKKDQTRESLISSGLLDEKLNPNDKLIKKLSKKIPKIAEGLKNSTSAEAIDSIIEKKRKEGYISREDANVQKKDPVAREKIKLQAIKDFAGESQKNKELSQKQKDYLYRLATGQPEAKKGISASLKAKVGEMRQDLANKLKKYDNRVANTARRIIKPKEQSR